MGWKRSKQGRDTVSQRSIRSQGQAQTFRPALRWRVGRNLLLISGRRAATRWTLPVGRAFTVRTAFAIEAMARAVLRTAFRRALRSGRTQFFHCQFAVAIFVQLLERFGRLRDFRLVNRAVVICVKRADERRRRRTLSFALWSAFAARRTFAVARLRFVLCKSYRWQRESQRHDECEFVFHNFILLARWFSSRHSLGRWQRKVSVWGCGRNC